MGLYFLMKGGVKLVGVEIDMVVSDSLKAIELYKKIFDLEVVEASNFEKGLNEVIFIIYGVRFHMLDENPEYNIYAPSPDAPKSIWYNVTVEDIEDTFTKAIDNGCTVIQNLMELPAFGVSNAIFMDPFGYIWMLHEVHKEVSHEERIKLWQDKKRKE